MNNELIWQTFNPGEGPVGTVEGELFKVRFGDSSEFDRARFFQGKWINMFDEEMTDVRCWALAPHRKRDGDFKYVIEDFPLLFVEEYSNLAIPSR